MIWEFTAVYANPHANVRKHLWGKLNEMRVERPWLIIGDFNYVLSGDERTSGRGTSSRFIDWVEQKALIDLGQLSFTWNHQTSVDTISSASLKEGCVTMSEGGCSHR